jgi:hypothetical protein
MSEQEKRYDERYDLELPVTVRWKDTSGHTWQATGATTNVSASGAFLVCDFCDSLVGEGCAIDLHFDDPIALGGSIPCRISANGTVVRDVTSVGHAQGYGYGIMFDHFSFTRLEQLEMVLH